MIYWGSENGFSNTNRSEILAGGPSGLNLRDPGNSYNRNLYEDYHSSVYEIPANLKPDKINWKAQTPNGTEVRFQVRVADNKENIQTAVWYGPEGAESWFVDKNSVIKTQESNFIQYRARLITPNAGSSPLLDAVTISFK
jgi:hypothetical protein